MRMALPDRLARYQSLLDLLVEAALREMEDEARPQSGADDTSPQAAHGSDAEGRTP